MTHPELVKTLCKSGSLIVSQLSPEQAHLLHMAVGISGEAGELLDAIKRHTIYQQPLDLVNVIEELGDLEFFMEGLRQAIDIPRKIPLECNIEKLTQRYGEKYTDQAAKERKDKA